MVRILRVRKVITVSWLFLAVSFCAGQTVKNGADQKSKPDFSGTWVLDNSKGVKRNYDLTLIIVHREPEIKITRKIEANGEEHIAESIYYTDGKAEWDSRKGYWDSRSATRWSGAKLVRRSNGNDPLSKDHMADVATTEEWNLSKDGKTLTLTVSNSGALFDAAMMSPSQGSLVDSKFVFTRKP